LLAVIYDASKRRDSAVLTSAYANLNSVQIARGQLSEAADSARRIVDLADQTHSIPLLIAGMTRLGRVLYARGKLADACAEFQRSDEVLSSYDPDGAPLLPVEDQAYCALLCDIGRWSVAAPRAMRAINEARCLRSRADAVLGNSSLGTALHESLRVTGVAPGHWAFEETAHMAQIHLGCAVEGGDSDLCTEESSTALLARASFLRDFGDRDQAERDLKEALNLSTRIGLRLHETDARLLQGHMALDEDPPDFDIAEASLARATELVTETGYHLLDADLLILEGRLLGKKGDNATGRAKLNEAITVARREEKDGCVYQVAVDQASRYLAELG